jgi:hypothetical protein
VKKRNRNAAAVAMAAGFMLIGTGCGTHSVSTAPDQVALQYKGGLSSKSFGSYIPPSTKKWFWPGSQEFSYPNNQRSYDATGGPGSESGPITGTSSDLAEMAVPVSVTFRLKTDEKSLRAFHENIGLHLKAYMEDDETTAGWRNMLAFYVGQPLKVSLDREVQGAKWRDLYSKPSARTALQNLLDKELPDVVKQKMQGDYFTDFQVTVQQPTPVNPDLKNAVAAQQAAVAQADSQTAQARAQQAAAQAQVAVAQAQARKQAAAIKGYGGLDGYLRDEAIQKGLNPFQPTYIVSGTK